LFYCEIDSCEGGLIPCIERQTTTGLKKGVDTDEFQKRSVENLKRELYRNDGDSSTEQASHTVHDIF